MSLLLSPDCTSKLSPKILLCFFSGCANTTHLPSAVTLLFIVVPNTIINNTIYCLEKAVYCWLSEWCIGLCLWLTEAFSKWILCSNNNNKKNILISPYKKYLFFKRINISIFQEIPLNALNALALELSNRNFSLPLYLSFFIP